MKVVARIPGEDKELYRRLRDSGLSGTKLVKNAVIVPIIDFQPLPDVDEYPFTFPPELAVLQQSVAELRLDADEQGYLYSSHDFSADAEIVCGLRGSMLRPYFIQTPCARTGYRLAASFSVKGGLVIVSAWSGKPLVTIMRYTIECARGQLSVRRTTVWAGEVLTTRWRCNICGDAADRDTREHHWCDGLPSKPSKPTDIEPLPPSGEPFRAAVLAARIKAECLECRHVHYGIVDSRISHT